MNIVLLGAPGSGKGTLAAQLKEHYKIPHISSGDMVRVEIKAGTPLGRMVAESTAKGLLLTDTPESMGQLLALLKTRLMQEDCESGFILDGVPRTLWQVCEVDRLLMSIGKQVDVALLLRVDHQTIISRLAGRVVCKTCSASYHQETNPPKTFGTCDRCQQTLIRRPDDEANVVTKRLEIYDEAIGPVLEEYSRRNTLEMVDGSGSMKTVFQTVTEQLQLREYIKKMKGLYSQMYSRDYLRTRIPSYASPKGYPFYNIIEVYKDTGLLQYAVKRMADHIEILNCDYLAAPEARALPLFGALSYKLGKPGIFLRKLGKLPADAPRLSAEYKTAYSTDTIEMNADSQLRGKKVVILDDGISSGGTILAATQLMERAGATVVGIVALIRYHYREPDAAYQPWESKTFTLFDL